MVLLTATFINDTGFATGLTPVVTIINANTGVSESHNMIEVTSGNYKYSFDNYIESEVYFFNYDAGTDTVINRYMGQNNNEVKVLYQMSGGGTSVKAEDEKKKEKEFIKKIVEEVKKELPSIEDIGKKVEENTVPIVLNLEKNKVEDKSGTILSSIEKNTKVIVNKIDKIKIPTYKEDIVISKLSKEIGNIKLDTKPIEIKLDKIDNKIKDYNELSDTLEEYIKMECDMEDMIDDYIEQENILSSIDIEDGD